jgi:hypothetical protein
MIRVAFHPADYARYERSLPRLRAEVDSMLDEEERQAGLRRTEGRLVSFESSTATAEGIPDVSATFADTRHRDVVVPAGATRRLTRHADAALRLPDGELIRITHTPFTIGRGPGNDLVIASLAVSREHAEISRSADGFIIETWGAATASRRWPARGHGAAPAGRQCDPWRHHARTGGRAMSSDSELLALRLAMIAVVFCSCLAWPS